jgi:hypothetical protein
MARVVGVIWVCEEAEYFCERDWTRQITLKLLSKIGLSRKIDFRAPTPTDREQRRVARSGSFWSLRHARLS